MKALTLWRPWDRGVTHLGKRVENRPRPPPRSVLGAEIAIHAGSHWDSGQFSWPADVPKPDHRKDPELRNEMFASSGCVVAVATVIGWLDLEASKSRTRELFVIAPGAKQLPVDMLDLKHDRWWLGPVGILLEDVLVLPHPVKVRGMQGWWNLPQDAESAVLADVVPERARRTEWGTMKAQRVRDAKMIKTIDHGDENDWDT